MKDELYTEHLILIDLVIFVLLMTHLCLFTVAIEEIDNDLFIFYMLV